MGRSRKPQTRFEMAELIDELEDELDPRVAVARVEERIAVYREAGWPVPEELARYQRDLMTELMAESQGR